MGKNRQSTGSTNSTKEKQSNDKSNTHSATNTRSTSPLSVKSEESFSDSDSDDQLYSRPIDLNDLPEPQGPAIDDDSSYYEADDEVCSFLSVLFLSLLCLYNGL